MQTQVCCMSWPEEWRSTNAEMSYYSHVSARGRSGSWFLLVPLGVDRWAGNDAVLVTNTVITVWTFLIRCGALTELVTFFFFFF